MLRYSPTQAEIETVMRETGMDHIQARNNLIGREHARQQWADLQRQRRLVIARSWREMAADNAGAAK